MAKRLTVKTVARTNAAHFPRMTDFGVARSPYETAFSSYKILYIRPMTDHASVWDAIEDTPAEAENMKLRSALMMALEEHIRTQGWTQAQAARRLGVTQPRVSDLLRGKIHLFGLDTLVNMVVAAGLHIEMNIAKVA